MTRHHLPLTAVLGLLAFAPAAAAQDGITLGDRNPAPGRDAPRETQIVAGTAADTYATRQSNKGAGGGAIYGCRSRLLTSRPADPSVSTPCLRVNNLAGGKAFDFAFDEGPLGGVIQSGPDILRPNPNAAPFITNAVAVALGLNADRVDGKHAADLVAEARARPGLDADKLDGLDAAEIVAAAQTAPSTCPAGTASIAGACLETAPRAAQTYAEATMTCGTAGRRLPPAAVLMHARSVDGIDLGDGEMAADVTATAVVTLPVVGDLAQPASYASVTDAGTVGAGTLETPRAFRCATA